MTGRVVLFDLDNTLHDRDAGLASFVRSQYVSRDLRSLGVSEDEWVEEFLRLDQGGKTWKDVVYSRLCGKFCLRIPPESLLEEYESLFFEHVRPNAGLVETLDALRERGWRTGIVTNGRPSFQRKTISALAIEPLLDTVIVSGECGLRKPDPAIFHLALSSVACKAEGSWFVGDDFEADVQGAKSAGMNALWFRRAGGFSVTEVSRLSEVLDRVP